MALARRARQHGHTGDGTSGDTGGTGTIGDTGGSATTGDSGGTGTTGDESTHTQETSGGDEQRQENNLLSQAGLSVEYQNWLFTHGFYSEAFITHCKVRGAKTSKMP
jgi:hypothetical protein